MARRKRGRDLHGILLFDKPAGCSSNQALQRVRRLFNANKAGHTGSLDPLATGMLPVCFGEATKLSGFLLDANKGYETTLQLGVCTDSADADGDVTEVRPVPAHLDQAAFSAVCHAFLGDQQQVPPMVSAIKVNGQRLYKLAREGRTIERAPRAVHFFNIDVLSFNGDTATLAVVCSKGTYIRSLVTDIGERIGCGAHVTALRRTHVAPFVEQSMWAESVLSDREDRDQLILPLDAGLEHMPKATLNDDACHAFRHGQSVHPAQLSAEPEHAGEIYRVYDAQHRMAGLGSVAIDGQLAPKRVLQLG